MQEQHFLVLMNLVIFFLNNLYIFYIYLIYSYLIEMKAKFQAQFIVDRSLTVLFNTKEFSVIGKGNKKEYLFEQTPSKNE